MLAAMAPAAHFIDPRRTGPNPRRPLVNAGQKWQQNRRENARRPRRFTCRQTRRQGRRRASDGDKLVPGGTRSRLHGGYPPVVRPRLGIVEGRKCLVSGLRIPSPDRADRHYPTDSSDRDIPTARRMIVTPTVSSTSPSSVCESCRHPGGRLRSSPPAGRRSRWLS